MKMAKITEAINNLFDSMQLLDCLDNEEYLAANGISPEEAEEFRKEIWEKIKGYEGEFADHMKYLSSKRQDLSIQAEWWLNESKRLKELADNYTKKVENIENRMDYLMKTFWKTELNTNLYRLSYRKSESVEIKDENLLPSEFINVTEVKKADKTAIKKAIKEWIDVPGATIIEKQNLQIK